MPTKLYLSGHFTQYEMSPQKIEKARATIADYNMNRQAKQKKKNYTERRMYSLTTSAKKKIISSAVHAVQKFPNDFHAFYTLTFKSGKWNPVYNDEIQKFYKSLTDKKRVNHKCKAYIWTKELTENHVVHYHCISIHEGREQKGIAKNLNNLWCDCRGYFSANALRTDKKNGIMLKSPTHSAAYAAKYAGKAQKGIEKFPSRIYQISNNIHFKPLDIPDGNIELENYLDENRIWTFKDDFFVVGQIKTKKSIEIFEQL